MFIHYIKQNKLLIIDIIQNGYYIYEFSIIFFIFSKYIAKSIGENLSENLSSKYSKKLPDHAKKSTIDALKTDAKIIIQKAAEATSDSTGSNFSDKSEGSVSRSAPGTRTQVKHKIQKPNY